MTTTSTIAHASQIAAALREHLPGVEGNKLHKLLYYVQGHHLALFLRPAFAEAVTAGPDGPEVAGDVAAAGDPHALPAGLLNVTLLVVSRYGGLTAVDLNRLTQAEAPWLHTAAGHAIDHDLLAGFFRADGAQEHAHRYSSAEVVRLRREAHILKEVTRIRTGEREPRPDDLAAFSPRGAEMTCDRPRRRHGGTVG